MLSLGWVRQNGKKNMEKKTKTTELILVIIAIIGFILTMILGGQRLEVHDLSYAFGYFACSIINFVILIRLLFQ